MLWIRILPWWVFLGMVVLILPPATRITQSYLSDRTSLSEALAVPPPTPTHIADLAPFKLAPPLYEFATGGFDTVTKVTVPQKRLNLSFLILRSDAVPDRSLVFMEHAFEDHTLDTLSTRLLSPDREDIVRGFYDPQNTHKIKVSNALADSEHKLVGEVLMAKAITGPREEAIQQRLSAALWPVLLMWAFVTLMTTLGAIKLFLWLRRPRRPKTP